MSAIPQSYPVVVESPESKISTLTGVLEELVHVENSFVLESGATQVRLNVVARDVETARRRASRIGQVVEVGSPSPLRYYANQKALPYRRSRVMSRFKRGRFNVQGGTGSHQAAAPPLHPADSTAPTSGVGMDVGESVDSLLGPAALTEATPAQRARRARRRAQARRKNPTLSRKRSRIAKRTSRRPSVAAKRKRSMRRTRRRTKRFRGRYDPHYESGAMTESQQQQNIESSLAGYDLATNFYRNIASAPTEWLQSNRGRKVVMDGIADIRLREGNAPADVLEAYYFDQKLPLTEPPLAASTVSGDVAEAQYEVKAAFIGDRETNIAVGNIQRFSEAVCDAQETGPKEATFKVNATNQEAAENHVRETLYRLNLKAGSVVKAAGSGVPLQLTQDARAETGTDPSLLSDL